MSPPARLRTACLGLALLALSLVVFSAPAGAKKKPGKGPHVSAVFELPHNLLPYSGGMESRPLASADGHLYVTTIEAEAAALRHGPPYKTAPIAELTASGNIKLIKDSLHPTNARWEGIGVGADGKAWVSASVHGGEPHLGVITGSSLKLHPTQEAVWGRLISFGGVGYTGTTTTRDNLGFGYMNIVPNPEPEFLTAPYVMKGGLVEFSPEYGYVNIPTGTYAAPGTEVEVKVPLQHIPGAPVGGHGGAAWPVQTAAGIWYLDEDIGSFQPGQAQRPTVLRKWGSSASYRLPGAQAGGIAYLLRGPDGKPWVVYQGKRSVTLARVNADGKLTDVTAPKGWQFGTAIAAGPGPYVWATAVNGKGEHGALIRISG